MSAAAELSAEQREVLAGLGDVMLPGGAGQPSAREVGLADRLVDEVLASRPDLAAPLRDLLERLRNEEPATALARLADDEPARELLGLVVAGGYLMSPAVGAALAYPGQQPKPVNPLDIVDVAADGLLDPVIERGPIYRLP
jgi:hypothetical protein